MIRNRATDTRSLLDVATTDPADGQALVWDDTAGEYVPSDVSGGTSLGDTVATETALDGTAAAAGASTDASRADHTHGTPSMPSASDVGAAPTPHGLGGAHHGADTLANLNAKVSDATLDDASDTRDPNAHALGGAAHTADTLVNLNSKVSDATLDDSGDPRDPNAHAASHQDGGADELNVAGLSGELADPQPPKAHALGGAEHNADTLASLNAKVSDATLDDAGDPRDPNAHASSHEPGGTDAMAVDAVAGTGSLRTLGTGAQQAAAGDHSHGGGSSFSRNFLTMGG